MTIHKMPPPISLRCLSHRGHCGGAARHRHLYMLRPDNQALTGYFLGAGLFLGDWAYRVITGRLDYGAAGTLRAVIDRTSPLTHAAAAHACIETRQVVRPRPVQVLSAGQVPWGPLVAARSLLSGGRPGQAEPDSA